MKPKAELLRLHRLQDMTLRNENEACKSRIVTDKYMTMERDIYVFIL